MDCSKQTNAIDLLPSLVAHADWGLNDNKRWMARALLNSDGRYHAQAPEMVINADTLLVRLREEAGMQGLVLVGFDFPIGVPLHFAELCDIDDFLTWMIESEEGKWADFYRVAEQPAQISPQRPFYPLRSGNARQAHLLQALNARNMDELRRQCELPHSERQAAAPLFWTLGGQQVGKAALSGWQEVIVPALKRSEDSHTEDHVVIWPFSGMFGDLLRPGNTILVETYPAEYYAHLGITFPYIRQKQAGKKPKMGKRSRDARVANATALINWTKEAGVCLAPALQFSIQDGFGDTLSGEDAFDAVIGLFGMLNVCLGFRLPGEPLNERLRRVEGWILGQNPAR